MAIRDGAEQTRKWLATQSGFSSAVSVTKSGADLIQKMGQVISGFSGAGIDGPRLVQEMGGGGGGTDRVRVRFNSLAAVSAAVGAKLSGADITQKAMYQQTGFSGAGIDGPRLLQEMGGSGT